MLPKRSEHAAGVDTPDLAAKKDCIILKAGVDKLDINSRCWWVKTLRKLSDVVDNQVVKNTKFNTLWTRVNKLYIKKNLHVTTLIHINQYNTDKQNLDKKLDMLINKYQTLVDYWLQLNLRIKLLMLVV